MRKGKPDMQLYEIETAKGNVVCYEQNGVYYPAYEADEHFLYEKIVSIEKIVEGEE